MSKQKNNMFSGFDAAAVQRAQEQDMIEIHIVGLDDDPPASRGRRRNGASATITLSISQVDKTLVKTFAAQHNTTVSALLHEWIARHCAGPEP